MSKIISIREIDLKPNTTPEEFEQYITEMPELDVPGMKVYYARADRGHRDGKYALFMEFDSVEMRNRLFPVADSPESTAEGEQLMAKYGAFMAKGRSMIAGDAGEDIYTDYAAMEK